MTTNAAAPLGDKRRSGCFGASLAFLALFVLSVFPTSVSAAAPDFFLQIPADSVAAGAGAGQLDLPRSMVADPDTGHLFVAERINARISEFTAWGEFVKAWGWDVAPEDAPGDTVSNQFEICTTSCQAGVKGTGVGQFHTPLGVTLDPAGDLYVHEAPLDNSSKRVQKFSPSGQFLLMFGGGVNQGPNNPGNLCTAQHITEGDTCGAGSSGTADGQFSSEDAVGPHITYNPKTDSIFVGDKDRIQEFGTDGKFEDKIDFEGSLSDFDGKSVESLAVDPVSGDLYFAIAITPDVQRLDLDTGEVIDKLEVNAPVSTAVDLDGNVYVVESKAADGGSVSPWEVLGFSASGDPIEGMGAGDDFAQPPPFSGYFMSGLATNAAAPGSEEPGNLYVNYFAFGISYIDVYGPPPIAFEDPPLAPPDIKDQYAISVDTDGALVRAEINPRFWADTRYRVQYATEACIEGSGWEAGCVSEEPVAPGTLLTAKSTNAALTTSAVFLGDLDPDTAYRYRFVARSAGSGQEDVFGVGGTLVDDGAEATFTTFPPADPPNTECPNQVFRIGPGAKLPDCRAYEMVSPLEKGNGDIRIPVDEGLHQGSTDGDGFTYTSSTPFSTPESAPSGSQYLSRRDPAAGWLSEAVSSPRTRAIDPQSLVKFKREFKAFSPDLCSAWLRPVYDPPLTSDAVPGFPNLYRRDNCDAGAGGFEALTTVTPPTAPLGNYGGLEAQGFSTDGTRVVYAAQDSLTSEAPPQGPKCVTTAICTYQLYLHTQGEPLRYICILPDGNPIDSDKQACYAGTTTEPFGDGREGSFHNALSADGEHVYWTAGQVEVGNSSGLGGGRIYLRLVEAEETIEVSQTVSGAKAVFWGASRDGSAALFEMVAGAQADNLYRFDTETGQETLIAKDALGLLGMSEDLSRVYFASEEVLPDSGQNGMGEEAVAGEPNLYLRVEEVGTRFVTTLPEENTTGVSSLAFIPTNRTARVSADGLHAAFMSTAPLTGYDNTDLNTGTPATEVFLYDADEDELRCVSCNPSGVRPAGKELRGKFDTPTSIQAAAQIPRYERSLYASRVLSDNGTRLFFESYEALVVRDTNGVQDVYQWEEAGAGDCEEADATFNEEAGGCVDLISSGESPAASSFRDASPSGNDVFFSTLSSLLPQDYGLVDIYDARVGGGLPQPTKVPGCEGEACQGPVVAPDDPTPGSSTFEGAGNLTEPPRPTKCAKGRRAVRKAGKTRCVKKPRREKRAKRANTKRRAAR